MLCLSVQATFACTRWSFVVSGCLLSPSQRAVTVVTRTLFPLIRRAQLIRLILTKKKKKKIVTRTLFPLILLTKGDAERSRKALGSSRVRSPGCRQKLLTLLQLGNKVRVTTVTAR